jgi:hypothetical protein
MTAFVSRGLAIGVVLLVTVLVGVMRAEPPLSTSTRPEVTEDALSFVPADAIGFILRSVRNELFGLALFSLKG